MSRLDDRYLQTMKCPSWREAFARAGRALGVPSASLKNLRDEFDPFHPNQRRGWHQRPLRPNRQRVLEELKDLSQDALAELVRHILRRDTDVTDEAIDALAVRNRVAENVAERLLTGRRAEEYFLKNCAAIVGVEFADLLDLRNSAKGYDFGVRHAPERAVEVKGLKGMRGDILFTDREWAEALQRRAEYWVVVVGNLAAIPRWRVVADPKANLNAACVYQRSVSATWRSHVSLVS
jgi:hypothetical protein